jgi:hypothetical protein
MDAWVEGVHQGVVAEVSPSQVWGGEFSQFQLLPTSFRGLRSKGNFSKGEYGEGEAL